MGIEQRLTQERLQELFEYDMSSGRLIWKARPELPAFRDAKFAGKPAGTHDSSGHIQISIDKKLYSAHRLTWLYHFGPIPDGMQIDHINGVRDDNRVVNLRLATPTGNSRNQKKQQGRSSKYKGVSFHKRLRKWQASIGALDNKKRMFLGYFENEIEAARAYDEVAAREFGEFAKLNGV
ncbi:hypothetical protein R77569_04539 [Ralstonia mannitolilytica]|uniref:AP2/ERF domain-containing protein n=1 Tax=Ralstonia mannitolilytica TaxID=105219 RepID=A0ABM9L0R9_9RALS|nr:HNH endonuclease [Ralstonia mannitolilytica]CAJ0895848.1 hypothetical protein R77569_04539 [Ralstonia mannitolilytica]